MILPRREGTRRFGAMAVALGYATMEQVEEALKIQAGLRRKGEPHKLIGIIMHEEGFLTNEELIQILQEMEREREGE